MNEEDKRREEEKAKHEQTKRKLKIIGTVLTVCGAILTVTCFVDFFMTMSGHGMPKLFFCGFIGLPLLGVGLMLLTWGNRREIGRYVKNEVVPVVNDAADELKPAITSVVNAVKEGVKEVGGSISKEQREEQGRVCPSCGALNQAENKFCDKCGTRLFKICPVCGAKQDGDDAYCGECGSKLD